MSQAQPFGAIPAPALPGGGTDVRGAIANAAAATGVDFDYLLAQARIESSLNPGARAPTSSAAGLYQFTNATWLATLERHGAEHGLDWAQGAISGGRVSDPAMRQAVMALRFDPQASALMAGELASDNRAQLAGTLGRDPDASELYLAHFLGVDGASRFLTAMAADPAQSAAALMPRAAAANHAIFFDAAGSPRSLGGVMQVLRAKVARAMDAPDLPATGAAWAEQGHAAPAAAATQSGPIATAFAEAAGAQAASLPPRASMADTLASTFALGDSGGGGGTPQFVRAAYGKLQAFGL